MQIAFVGLGRMGGNMVHRLRRDGDHDVVAFDPSEQARAAAAAQGARPATSLQDMVAQLQAPRAVWNMVPAQVTEQTIDTLMGLLEPGDTIIDGGNSNFRDSMRRAAACTAKGLHFIDAGTSGGVWGLEVGYCLMVGGEPAAVARVAPVFTTLAPPNGWLHVGPAGSGHFVKMVHNGVEYGMLQAYAEGFDILHASQEFHDLDMHAISHLWNQGSVVRSWLLELAERAFEQDPGMEKIRGWVDDTGEGRWTVLEAVNSGVPAPVITLSLMARFQSRQPDGYGNKVIAALRNQFGGHAVQSEPASDPGAKT